jgi:hypothetical protein
MAWVWRRQPPIAMKRALKSAAAAAPVSRPAAPAPAFACCCRRTRGGKIVLFFSNRLLLRERRLRGHPLRARPPTCSPALPGTSAAVPGRRGRALVDGILPLPRLAVAGALDGRLCRDPPAERSVSEPHFPRIVDLRPSDLPI